MSESIFMRLDMTDRVKTTYQAITLILRVVLWNFRQILNLCLENNGTHFEHLILRMIRNDNLIKYLALIGRIIP